MLGVHLRRAFTRCLEFIKHGYVFIIFTVPNIEDSTDMGTRRKTRKRTAKRDDVVKNGEQGEIASRIQDMEGGRGGGKRPNCLEETH